MGLLHLMEAGYFFRLARRRDVLADVAFFAGLRALVFLIAFALDVFFAEVRVTGFLPCFVFDVFFVVLRVTVFRAAIAVAFFFVDFPLVVFFLTTLGAAFFFLFERLASPGLRFVTEAAGSTRQSAGIWNREGSNAGGLGI